MLGQSRGPETSCLDLNPALHLLTLRNVFCLPLRCSHPSLLCSVLQPAKLHGLEQDHPGPLAYGWVHPVEARVDFRSAGEWWWGGSFPSSLPPVDPWGLSQTPHLLLGDLSTWTCPPALGTIPFTHPQTQWWSQLLEALVSGHGAMACRSP